MQSKKEFLNKMFDAHSPTEIGYRNREAFISRIEKTLQDTIGLDYKEILKFPLNDEMSREISSTIIGVDFYVDEKLTHKEVVLVTTFNLPGSFRISLEPRFLKKEENVEKTDQPEYRVANGKRSINIVKQAINLPHRVLSFGDDLLEAIKPTIRHLESVGWLTSYGETDTGIFIIVS